MKKFIMAAVAAAFLCAPAAGFAGPDIDVAKIKCKDFLSQKENEIGQMLLWIDGYMSAKSNNTTMSDAWMEKLGKHMGTYCAKNGDKTIMDAMEAMPAE